MQQKQFLGMVGALAAFLVCWLVLANSGALFASAPLPVDRPDARLAFVIGWLLVPGLTLLIGVVAAGRRGFYADAIDGTRTPSNHALEINLRYNLNTVEQVVLAAIAWIGLALALPHDRLILIPMLAALFAVGRLTFWVGYLIQPVARAFGMTMTVLPTLLAYAWLCWRAVH